MSTSFSFSRRGFLGRAAAGAAAVALTRTSFGADTPAPAAGPALLRWGVIGTGTRGGFTHIPVLKQAPESQTVALCDVSPERLQSAAAKVGHPVETYSDYQKLLANPDINAVVIATPNLFHREMLAAAIQAGKHVLCEKPAGAGPADAAEMERDAAASKHVVMFGMQYRNNARQRKIYEILASGEIGKPRYIVQNCSRGDWNLSPNVWRYVDPKIGKDPVNWRFSHTASGGTLNEFSCHYLDLLHGYAGALPTSVSADGGISVYHDGRDTWDHATVTLKYPNDLVAVHTLCLFGPGHGDTRICGDEGSIDLIGETFKLTHYVKNGNKKRSLRAQDIELTEPPGHGVDYAVLDLYKDFLDCVKTGKKPDASPTRAMAASRTCWLAELASDRKAEVKWDDLNAHTG